MSNIKEFLAITTVENKIDDLDTSISQQLTAQGQSINNSLNSLQQDVDTSLGEQETLIETSFAAQAVLIDGVSRQIVIGTPNALTNRVKFTASANWTAPFTGTVYVTATGGGGGGAGGLVGPNSNNRGGGAGGSGGNTAYRVPLQVTQGDVVRITIGAGGSGGTRSTSTQRTGGNGSATKVENITALANKPALELTVVTHVIEVLGGVGGRTSSSRVIAAATAAPESFIVDVQRVGFLVRGGSGGLGQLTVNGRRVSSLANGSAAGSGLTTAWTNYPRRSTRGDAGGAGGSAFSLVNYGTGGQGGNSGSVPTGNAQSGQPGVAYIEYN